MKIAFDLRRIGNPGIGRYMKCLVEAILRLETECEYLLLLPSVSCELKGASADNVTRIVPRSGYYSVREQIELPRILRQHKVDLLHSPHFLLPLVQACPGVVTIHDVIYLACRRDLQSSVGRLYYNTMMRASARLAKRIITDSNFSKDEIVKYLKVAPEKISVVCPAADSSFGRICDSRAVQRVLAKYLIDSDYVLYTGIYKPRKNHDGLLRAFNRLLAAGGYAKLVIAGPIGEGQQRLHKLAIELGISERVIFTGNVTDAELCALYSGARVYACPSLYEGFGFTVLEAMACGAPVVCSAEASLPEVGGDAALYANARDPESFGQALYEVFTSDALRERLIERGYSNVRRFSWEDAANGCLETYAEILGDIRGAEVAFT